MNIRHVFLLSLSIASAPAYSLDVLGWAAAAEAERQAYNDHNLTALKKQLDTNPETVLALVSDLHDVLFDRLPGDFERGKQLGAVQMCSFLGHLVPFGCTYLAYKLGLAYHPNIEYHVINLGGKKPNKELLQLISPFTLNKDMAELYKSCKYPVFVCSNIGQQSYDYLDKNFGCDKLFMDKQIATPENGYLQKDRPETYQALYTNMTQKMGAAPKALLMIDDRTDNLATCEMALRNISSTAVYGFIFTNYTDFNAALECHGLKNIFEKQS